MANEVPGVRVPEDVVERMRRAEDAAAEGVAIAREIGAILSDTVQGIYVAAPSGRLDFALQVVDGLR